MKTDTTAGAGSLATISIDFDYNKLRWLSPAWLRNHDAKTVVLTMQLPVSQLSRLHKHAGCCRDLSLLYTALSVVLASENWSISPY